MQIAFPKYGELRKKSDTFLSRTTGSGDGCCAAHVPVSTSTALIRDSTRVVTASQHIKRDL